VNQREKEQYLREYALLKQQGKPFFPYAVAKDSIMAAVTMLAIILMALFLGAELGPKADPTTTTYSPRPEWYFFFLFELLKIIKPANLVPLATIGIPTICMILLFLLPFYDRGPERRPERRRSPPPRASSRSRRWATSPTWVRPPARRPPSTSRRRSASSPRAARCSSSTTRASRWSPRPAAWPATRSGRTATTGPGRR
jgi:hypothetical protein